MQFKCARAILLFHFVSIQVSNVDSQNIKMPIRSLYHLLPIVAPKWRVNDADLTWACENIPKVIIITLLIAKAIVFK